MQNLPDIHSTHNGLGVLIDGVSSKKCSTSMEFHIVYNALDKFDEMLSITCSFALH